MKLEMDKNSAVVVTLIWVIVCIIITIIVGMTQSLIPLILILACPRISFDRKKIKGFWKKLSL